MGERKKSTVWHVGVSEHIFVGSSQWFGMLHVLEERDLWAANSPARCRDGIEVWAWLCKPATSHPVLCNAWFSRSVILLLGKTMQVMSKCEMYVCV